MDHQEQIRKVTSELEQHNSANLPGLLQGKFEEQRIRTLNEIVAQNAADRQGNSNIPRLDLEVTTGFTGFNGLRLTSNDGSFHDSMLGPDTLYNDSLNLVGLKHSNGEASPANRKEIDVRKLTTDLENGQSKGTTQLLSGFYEEERVRVFKQVGELNTQDIKDGKTQAQLKIQITPNKVGDDSISVERVIPGIHDSFLGGEYIYGESLQLRTNLRGTWEKTDDRK